MSEFYEVLKLEWGPAQYEIRPMPIQYDNNSPNIENWYMGMKGYDFPRSIYVHEFDYLKNLVIDYNLKSGYEVATAFGLSALALGLGFKETGGKLVTMDAYIEESQIEIEDYIIRYRNEGPNTVTDAMGYKSANYLMEYFRLKDVVKVEIGYSPIDVGRILGKNIDKKLDFAFIDAGHFPEQVIKDLQAIIPFLGDEYVIALHDCFPYMITPEVEEFIRKSFGKDVALAVTWPYGYNLGVIINKKKPVTQV